MSNQLDLFASPEKKESSLDRAIRAVKEGLDDGVECPCCEQFCKIYPRKLNANMVMFLISLVRVWEKQGGGWVHYSACKFKGRDYPFLTFWGLAETGRSVAEESEKRMSGKWRPTELGVLFAKDEVRVSQRLHIFNNTVISKDTETVGVVEALGSPFHYRELMGQWQTTSPS